MIVRAECKECKRMIDAKGMIKSVCVDCQELIKVWKSVAPTGK